MASTQDARVRMYVAPSPHGDLSRSGVRGWVARRPLTTFLVVALGASWLLFVVPVLAYHPVIPGAGLPIEIFALAATLLVLLPAALGITAVTDGRAGVRALLGRAIRWRFSVGWWLAVIFGLPVIALLLGLASGGSLHATGAGSVLLKQSLSILLAVVVINVWEETVWAGFFQTRLENRFPFVVAALLTALPFAGVHLPLLLLSDHVTLWSVLKGIVGLVGLGAAIRLLLGVFLRACADSVLAVGVLHQVFDACNNAGGLVDSLLDGADAALMTEIGVVMLTVAAAAVLWWHRGAAVFARRRAPTAMPPTAS